MPVATDHRESAAGQSAVAAELAGLAAALRATAHEVNLTAGTSELHQDLRFSIRHLEDACGSLAAWAAAMAFAATNDVELGPLAVPPPAARATAWHLRRLSGVLRTARDTCHVAGEAAEGPIHGLTPPKEFAPRDADAA